MLFKPCICCTNHTFELVVTAPDFEYSCIPGNFQIFKCKACNHHFIHPIPMKGEINEFYPLSYYTINTSSPLYLSGFIYKMKIQNDIKRILKLIKTHSIKSMLDLGCGDASRLIGLKCVLGDQIEATGYDLAFQDNTLAKAKNYGVNLNEGNIEDELTMLNNNSLDFVLMNQIIEHIIDPELLLKEAYKKLKPGGLLLIETPNLAGLDYYIFRKYFWGGYHVPRHIHLFDQHSLLKLLISCNFTIMKKGSLPSPGFWIISLRNLFGLNSKNYSRSPFEVLNFSSIPIVTLFYLLDKALIATGLLTSNQYVLSRKPNCI